MNRSEYLRPPEGRPCARCKRELPLSAFAPDARLQDGLKSWCRACHVAATREWRAKNSKKINRRTRAAYAQDREAINARRRELYAMRGAA